MASKIYTAPPNTGTPVLGKTLPDVLYEACAQYTNPTALNQPKGDIWEPLSLKAFRNRSEELALGLLKLGLQRGEKVALFMESDVPFCIADMGCLIAGLVDVPIYLSHNAESIAYVLNHAEAQAVIVSDHTHLATIAALLPQVPAVEHVLVAEFDEAAELPELPEHVRVQAMDAVRLIGREQATHDPGAIAMLLPQIDPHDVATLIYTSGTTGTPKGVMLTHENISYNALTAFSGMTGYRPGPAGEVALSFLPMTHIFARSLHYGILSYGSSVYFTTPENLARDFQRVRPTTFATVPRVLEKVYAKIVAKADTLKGVKGRLLKWGLHVAAQYEMGERFGRGYRTRRRIADKLIYEKWREALGGRVRIIVSGGAALNGDIANAFAAAGIHIMQGYGLTETSPIITYNRPENNRAGTVGVPLPGLEVRIAEDGEILTRGPHIMKGYYKDEVKTREAIDPQGWFHTGDIGEVTDEGFLRITDRKKDLFKLSTGKYVMPQPLENALTSEPLIEQAVVVGPGHKMCGVLLFPNQEALRALAQTHNVHAEDIETLCRNEWVRTYYQQLVDEANAGLPHWSTIKCFTLIPQHLTIENGLLTPTLKVKRTAIYATFADEIKRLYEQAERDLPAPAVAA